MKGSNVKIYFSKKPPAVADLQITFWERKNKKEKAQAQIFSETALCGYFLLSSIQHGRPVKQTMLFERERATASKQVRHSEGFQEKLAFRACLDPQPTPFSQTQPTQIKKHETKSRKIRINGHES